ncbi:MAG: hypothetical protein ABI347_01820 [Nitrososphaera sp.]|jgi:hypothetical protein
MNKNVYLAGVLAAFLLAGAAVAGAMPVFADDDKDEDNGAREGSSSSSSLEREGDHGDDDERGGVGGLSGLILYGVIAAVVGTIGYTAYKIFVARKKAVRTHP